MKCKHCGHDPNEPLITRSVVVDQPDNPVSAMCTLNGCQHRSLRLYDYNAHQQRHRENSIENLKRRGFKEGELQDLYRRKDVLTRPWDTGEVYDAICDALTREGCIAWPGDGTGCVMQMIQIQYDARIEAERKLAELLKDK